MQRSKVLLATSMLLAVFGASCATPPAGSAEVTPQRPKFSRDTRTTASGTLELEAGLAIDPGDSLDSPMALKYGLDANTELFADFSPLRVRDRPGDDEVGIGDLGLGVRQRVRDETESDPSFGWRLRAKLPTADEDEGLGSGELDLFGAAIASKTLEAYFVTGFYQLGLLGERRDAGLDLEHGLAVSATRPIDESWRGFGELALRWSPERDRESLFTTLGVGYAARPSLVFDAGLVLGLSDDAPDFALLVGLTQSLGALRDQ